jgi:cell division protein FtsX
VAIDENDAASGDSVASGGDSSSAVGNDRVVDSASVVGNDRAVDSASAVANDRIASVVDNASAVGNDRVASGVVDSVRDREVSTANGVVESARIVVETAQVIGTESVGAKVTPIGNSKSSTAIGLGGPPRPPASKNSRSSASTNSSDAPRANTSDTQRELSSSIRDVSSNSRGNVVDPSRTNASDAPVRELSSTSSSTSLRNAFSNSRGDASESRASDAPVRELSSSTSSSLRDASNSRGNVSDAPARELSSSIRDAPVRELSSSIRDASSNSRGNDSDTPSRENAAPRFTREALRSSAIARMGSSVRRAFRFAFHGPRAGLWSMLVVVCAMIVVGVSALAAKHVDAWTVRPGDGASMVVYLGESVDDVTAQKLLRELRGLPGVEHAELVAPEESAKRLQAALGSDASLMEGVDVGSLPASVEVTLAPGVREVVAMSPTVRALRGAPGVEDVVLDEPSEDRTSAALGTVRTVVWTGAALLAGLALIMAFATIRLRLDRDPEEQRVAHMLGAGPGYMIVPSILAGMLIGAIAALIAGVAIVSALHAYGDAIVGALAGPLGAIELAMPTLVELAMFVGLGAALGVIGGGLAGASRVAR